MRAIRALLVTNHVQLPWAVGVAQPTEDVVLMSVQRYPLPTHHTRPLEVLQILQPQRRPRQPSQEQAVRPVFMHAVLTTKEAAARSAEIARRRIVLPVPVPHWSVVVLLRSLHQQAVAFQPLSYREFAPLDGGVASLLMVEDAVQ
jgi:hypothetical protein